MSRGHPDRTGEDCKGCQAHKLRALGSSKRLGCRKTCRLIHFPLLGSLHIAALLSALEFYLAMEMPRQLISRLMGEPLRLSEKVVMWVSKLNLKDPTAVIASYTFHSSGSRDGREK